MRPPGAIVVLLLLSGCPTDPDWPTVDDGGCTSWRTAQHEANITDTDLTEISGISRSHRIHDTLWVHEDRGGSPFVTAVGTDGAKHGTFSLAGAAHEDWEDIALGPCGDGAGACSCLYLADIGDNNATRDEVVIYRVPEPDPEDVDASGVIGGVQTLWFRYPDGPRDAETLLVDPRSGETLVVSKASTGQTTVYAFPDAPPVPASESAPVELQAVATLDLKDLGANRSAATAGDVSPHGLRVVLRTDDDVLVFTAPDGGTIRDALDGNPLVLEGPSGANGEGLAVSADGRTLWLAGEAAQPDLWTITCASFQSDGDDDPDPLVHCDATGP